MIGAEAQVGISKWPNAISLPGSTLPFLPHELKADLSIRLRYVVEQRPGWSPDRSHEKFGISLFEDKGIFASSNAVSAGRNSRFRFAATLDDRLPPGIKWLHLFRRRLPVHDPLFFSTMQGS